MLGVDAGVVAEHEFLIVQNEVRVVGGEIHADSVHAARLTVGVIAHVVYRRRDDNEENNAERAVSEKRLHLKIAQPVDEPYDRKSGSGIKTGPFARGAYAEKQSRKRKVVFSAAGDVHIHEKIHEQDEENGVGVDRGKARLRKVHEVKCKDRRCTGADVRRTEHAL